MAVQIIAVLLFILIGYPLVFGAICLGNYLGDDENFQ